ncbi:hypothetical protein HUG17_3603 [Dermatophagoides farinae]|uniref:Uncharacterized protein n=1 Tax=Dermatophagoides farinae TaxID=6954 RepID=A0A9D4NUR6_DERFA|nr:hypothetical protein HUG17_3603 [Dermatophagoides farinae]
MLEMIQPTQPTKIVALSLTKWFNWTCILSLIVMIFVLVKLFLWIYVLQNVHHNQDLTNDETNVDNDEHVQIIRSLFNISSSSSYTSSHG